MNENNKIKMIVEIPKGTSNKYEYDFKKNKIILDRVLYGSNFYPGEYGYIPKTLDYDGDPLDIISLITYPTFPGCLIKIRILANIKMIDSNIIDNKLFGVVDSDPRFNNYQNLKDIPKHLINEINDFFWNYKKLQKKKIIIKGWGDLNEALNELNNCKNMFQKYKDKLQILSKKELILMLKQNK